MLRRKTTAIVRGNTLTLAFAKKAAPDEDGAAEKNGQIDAARRRLASLLLPLAALLVFLVLLLCLTGAQGISLSEGQFLVAVPAENALLETIEAGDVVQVFTADGSIGSIRYVSVASVGEDSCCLVMEERQLRDFLSIEGKYVLLPCARGNAALSEELLDLQRQWNTPTVKLSLDRSMLEIEVGSSTALQLTLDLTPTEATVPTVTWRSTDETVALVDDDGIVTAVGSGTAEIIVASGEAEARCKIRVPVYAETLAFESETLRIAVGTSVAPAFSILPTEADEPLTWSSSDESVVSVGSDGTITANAEGSAVITVSGQKATASCTVECFVTTENIVLSSNVLELTRNATSQLAAVVMPENASDRTVRWSSSDENVAVVYNDGVVLAKSVGEAVITAQCGDVSVSCKVIVS